MSNKNFIRYALVVLMFLALTLNGFTNMVFSARAVDVMEKYGMTQTQLTSISGVSNLGGFFFSILVGYLTDRFGLRNSHRWCSWAHRQLPFFGCLSVLIGRFGF